MSTSAHDLFVTKINLINILRGCSDQLRNFMTEVGDELKNSQQDFERGELLRLYNSAKSSNVQLLDEIELLIKEPIKNFAHGALHKLSQKESSHQ
jgi:hypothetical protein